MTRLVLLLSFTITIIFIACFGVLRVVFDKSRSIFPADLPERPPKTPKLQFAKRWSQELASSKTRRNLSIDDSYPLQSLPEKHISTAFATSVPPFTRDVTSHHVRTRCASTYVAEPAGNNNSTTPQSHGIGPRLRQAVSSLKIPKFSNSESASSVPLEDAVPRSINHEPLQSLYSLRRKPVASNPNSRMKDPLVDRFERLRLPHNGKPQPRSQVPATSSLSLQTSSSSPLVASKSLAVLASNHALKSMSVSNVVMPAQAQTLTRNRPRNSLTPASKTGSELPSTSTIPIGLDDSDDDGDTHPVAKRFHYPSGRPMHVNKRARSPPPRRPSPVSRRLRRRIQSPSDSSDTLSEGELTPISSRNVSYPALPVESVGDERVRQVPRNENRAQRFLDSKDALLLQEEMDRRFAQSLQNEEDEDYQREQSLHAQLQASERQLYASPPVRRKEQQRRGFGRRTISGRHHGTRDDPIDLDTESDLDSNDSDDSDNVVFTGRATTGRPLSDDADPTDLDEDDWGSTDDEVDPNQTNEDASLAQLLQDEERSQQAATYTRDCVVCSESHPISELPALAECEHIPQTCGDCYAGWVAAQLQDSGWNEAKCPESKCKIKLNYYEIRQVVTTETFLQYDTFIARAAISEDRKFEFLEVIVCKANH
jgi:hypothetical protein